MARFRQSFRDYTGSGLRPDNLTESDLMGNLRVELLLNRLAFWGEIGLGLAMGSSGGPACTNPNIECGKGYGVAVSARVGLLVLFRRVSFGPLFGINQTNDITWGDYGAVLSLHF